MAAFHRVVLRLWLAVVADAFLFSHQACTEFLRLTAATAGAPGMPPAPLEAVRCIINSIRSHQSLYADPLPYDVDGAVEACLVAFPGVASSPPPGQQGGGPSEPQDDVGSHTSSSEVCLGVPSLFVGCVASEAHALVWCAVFQRGVFL